MAYPKYKKGKTDEQSKDKVKAEAKSKNMSKHHKGLNDKKK